MSTMERDRDRRTPGRDDTMRSKKSESFMEKLSGTLTRKKKPQHDEMGGGNVEVREQTHKDHKDHKDRPEEDEIAEVEYEGREALDHSLVSPLARTERLEEGEQHRYLSKESAQDPKVREVVDLLVYWLNQEMAGERIVVRHIQEDLYDGQVIQKLVEKLADIKIEVPEVSQSEEGQRQKLQIVIGTANRVLQQGYDSAKWSAEMIHDKDVVAIIQLLYALAVHFRAPVRFPENVSAKVVTARKEGGHIKTEHVMEQLTGTQQELGPKGERDAFDTLFDYGPDKLAHVKTSLLAFCNKHLNKINLEVTDLDHQFQDGVFLVLLMGLLEGYFVPLYCFNLQVASYEDKVKNVQFAYKLMEDAGLPKPRSRVQDIANGDLKGRSILMEKKMNKSSDGGGAEDGNLKNSKNGTPKTNESRQQDLNLPPKKEFKQAALTNFFKPVDSAENPSCSPKSHVQPSINSVAATGSSSTISDKSTDSNSSFTVTGSQRKKIEERIKAIERKIASAWARRDYKTYQTHVASASQFPLSVILGIENEIHRFAVVKEKNKVKDREKLKMIASKEQKEEYRKQVAEERKAVYKEMDPKIKAHFNTKILIEDWRISQKNLAPLGKKIDLLPDENALFSECLMLAQIPFSLKGFIQYNGKLHSEELFEALENGEDGFADATYHLLESFCRFFCEKDRRHFMTSTSVKNLPKVLKEQLSLVNISTFTHKILRNMLHRITGKYDTSKSVDKDEDDQIESEAESGRSTPMERYLDDEEELQFLYSEFPEDKEFYQLRPELQIRILIYLADNILHHEVYKSYTADRQGNAPKTIAQLNEEQKHITEELATLTNDLDYAAVDEDTDEEELLTRAEARKREEKRKKAQKITKRIDELKQASKEIHMEIAEERSNIHSAKRIRPIGRDRHMRQYFWFNNDTNDDGIWIQDLGVTNGETYLRELYKQIRQSRKRKLDDKENTSQDARGEQNGKAGENDVVEIKRNNSISQHLNDMSVLSQRNRDESQSQDLSQTINFSQGLEDSMCDIDVIDNSLCQPEGPLSETWYHITDKETLVKLRDSLLERGERESELKNFLKKNFTEIAKSMEKFAKKVEAVNEAKEESEDEDEVQMVENED